MHIKEIVVRLAPEEVLRLHRILVDENREEAMLFLKECLKPHIEASTREH